MGCPISPVSSLGFRQGFQRCSSSSLAPPPRAKERKVHTSPSAVFHSWRMCHEAPFTIFFVAQPEHSILSPQPCVYLQEAEFKVEVSEYLGPLLFVRVQKWHYLTDDAWFCNWISVKGPGDQGSEYMFPCYRWLQGRSILSLPEGTGEQRGGSVRRGIGETA